MYCADYKNITLRRKKFMWYCCYFKEMVACIIDLINYKQITMNVTYVQFVHDSLWEMNQQTENMQHGNPMKHWISKLKVHQWKRLTQRYTGVHVIQLLHQCSHHSILSINICSVLALTSIAQFNRHLRINIVAYLFCI